MGTAIRENPIEIQLGKFSNLECLFVHREKGLFLSVYVDDIKSAGKTQNINPMWKVLNEEIDLENQHLSLILYTWDVLKDYVRQAKILLTITETRLTRISAGATEKITMLGKIFVSLSWS